jgi:hypothetical protein
MPVVVTCQCGRRFAASDQLVAQDVPCPACGNLLSIADAYSTSQEIYVSCECGRAFCAPPYLRGKNTQCPGCGGNIKVPGYIDLSAEEPSAKELVKTHTTTLLLPDRELEIPWERIRRICAIGILALVALAGALWIYELAHTEVKLAWTPSAAPAEVASKIPVFPYISPVLPPPPPIAATEPTTESSDTAEAPEAVAVIPAARLSHGVQDWYGQAGVKHSGIRRANATDPALAQFSWLTSLLPFLGHQGLYERFDFSKSLTDGKNVQLGGTIVPEFLNPGDDNQRWRGHPLDGSALTHFVGISGVEDARNVVAAKLPRSDPRAGIFGYDEVARPEEITDGTSHTAMVAGAGALPNPWVFGGGATIRGAREPLFEKTSGLGTKGAPGGGTVVMMADGSVRQVSGNIDPRVFKAMCTTHGAESYDLERASKPFDIRSLREPPK